MVESVRHRPRQGVRARGNSRGSPSRRAANSRLPIHRGHGRDYAEGGSARSRPRVAEGGHASSRCMALGRDFSHRPRSRARRRRPPAGWSAPRRIGGASGAWGRGRIGTIAPGRCVRRRPPAAVRPSAAMAATLLVHGVLAGIAASPPGGASAAAHPRRCPCRGASGAWGSGRNCSIAPDRCVRRRPPAAVRPSAAMAATLLVHGVLAGIAASPPGGASAAAHPRRCARPRPWRRRFWCMGSWQELQHRPREARPPPPTRGGVRAAALLVHGVVARLVGPPRERGSAVARPRRRAPPWPRRRLFWCMGLWRDLSERAPSRASAPAVHRLLRPRHRMAGSEDMRPPPVPDRTRGVAGGP